MPSSNYNDQIFINCPFDNEYLALFRACIFTVLDAGFIARCSQEIDDATQFRLSGILDLIADCRYAIHDLSRVQLDKKSRLPRFNMPFELGVFYGVKYFGGTKHKQKQCIILEKQKYRYQNFISDISGIDVTPHGDSSKKLVYAIRNWLVTASRRTTIPDGGRTYSRFLSFQSDMKKVCKENSISYDSMPFVEVVKNMSDWLRINQVTHQPLFV